MLEELQEALDIYQVQGVGVGAGGKGPEKSRLVKATCPGCGRIIRASRQVFDAGPIVCEPCGEAFEPEEDDDRED